jgi:hypothetical protein
MNGLAKPHLELMNLREGVHSRLDWHVLTTHAKTAT